MAFGLRRKVEATVEAQRAARRDVELATIMLLGSGETIDVTIRNLSTSGFLATSASGLSEGQMLRIRLGAGRMRHARVARCNGERYGCEFLAAVAEDELPF